MTSQENDMRTREGRAAREVEERCTTINQQAALRKARKQEQSIERLQRDVADLREQVSDLRSIIERMAPAKAEQPVKKSKSIS